MKKDLTYSVDFNTIVESYLLKEEALLEAVQQYCLEKDIYLWTETRERGSIISVLSDVFYKNNAPDKVGRFLTGIACKVGLPDLKCTLTGKISEGQSHTMWLSTEKSDFERCSVARGGVTLGGSCYHPLGIHPDMPEVLYDTGHFLMLYEEDTEAPAVRRLINTYNNGQPSERDLEVPVQPLRMRAFVFTENPASEYEICVEDGKFRLKHRVYSDPGLLILGRCYPTVDGAEAQLMKSVMDADFKVSLEVEEYGQDQYWRDWECHATRIHGSLEDHVFYKEHGFCDGTVLNAWGEMMTPSEVAAVESRNRNRILGLRILPYWCRKRGCTPMEIVTRLIFLQVISQWDAATQGAGYDQMYLSEDYGFLSLQLGSGNEARKYDLVLSWTEGVDLPTYAICRESAEFRMEFEDPNELFEHFIKLYGDWQEAQRSTSMPDLLDLAEDLQPTDVDYDEGENDFEDDQLPPPPAEVHLSRRRYYRHFPTELLGRPVEYDENNVFHWWARTLEEKGYIYSLVVGEYGCSFYKEDDGTPFVVLFPLEEGTDWVVYESNLATRGGWLVSEHTNIEFDYFL